MAQSRASLKPPRSGIKDTLVRRLIARALDMIGVPGCCLSMVVHPGAGLCGLSAGGYLRGLVLRPPTCLRGFTS